MLSGAQKGFVWEASQAHKRVWLVSVQRRTIAGTHLPIDGDRLVLPVDVGAETPRILHELRVLKQDTSFRHELTIDIGLLGTNGLPGDAIATESRSRNRQATKTIDDGEGTVLIEESLLDVIGRCWVRIFREVDSTIGVDGCCQDTRRNARQAKVTLEQAASLQKG